MKKAIIKQVSRGARKGEYRFVLKAANGETIATSGTESYTQKHNCLQVVLDHFPDFAIEDTTLLTKKKK